MKIQTKTTLLFTLLTLSVFLVLTGIVYYFSNQFAYNDFYKRLELRARIAAKFNFEKEHTNIEGFKEIQREYLERLADEKSYIIKMSADGKPVKPYPKKLPQSYFEKIKNANGATQYFNDNTLHYAGIFYKDETGDFYVIESATNTYGAEIITRLGNILIITLIASTILIYSVGLYFSNRTFKPFRNITEHANDISEDNLQLRLEETNGSDEVSEFITTFNKMLARLQTAFQSQNNFVSNASHELRTPLTAIIAEADYALAKQRAAEDYRASLQQIMQQADKLQHITTGLLSLAKTSFDGSKQQLEKIRVDILLNEVKETTTGIFPQCDIQIETAKNLNAAEYIIEGNWDLLNIAIGNIMMNACKYAANAPVQVILTALNKEVQVTIADEGIGIPQDEIENITNPFFRASNTAGFEGYGVGLSLSKNIIRLHKGSITIHSKIKQGTEVIITLPLA